VIGAAAPVTAPALRETRNVTVAAPSLPPCRTITKGTALVGREEGVYFRKLRYVAA
jgi:hypothetical protein